MFVYRKRSKPFSMNRTYFWILTCLSSLIALLLIFQIILIRITTYDQSLLAQKQQFVNQGQQCEIRMRQLATRIYQVSQQTQDQGLKDLLTRQQITITPPTDSTTNSEPIAPASH